MTHLRRAAWLPIVFVFASCTSDTPNVVTSLGPSPQPGPNVTVSSVSISGTNSFTQRGQTAQLTATATMSNGTTEDRTSTATWTSDNTVVATVSATGLVTAAASGDATISATVSAVRGTRPITVRLPFRTPDPAPGQRIPLPDIEGFMRQTAAARPDLLSRSCPNGRKYENNPWLDYMVDALRTRDTRWGYNGKPTRGPADNFGFPVIAAGDEIAYHFSGGPDQNSPDVYLIDILTDHCGNNPTVSYRHFTGEEPGFWSSAGRAFTASVPSLVSSSLEFAFNRPGQ